MHIRIADIVNQTLLDIEKQLALGPTFVARLLGVAYPTYAAYRSGARPLPRYIARSVGFLSTWAAQVAEPDQVEGQKFFQEYIHVKSQRS